MWRFDIRTAVQMLLDSDNGGCIREWQIKFDMALANKCEYSLLLNMLFQPSIGDLCMRLHSMILMRGTSVVHPEHASVSTAVVRRSQLTR